MIRRLVSNYPISSYRAVIFFTLGVIIPLGFASKFYQGAWGWWVRDYAGDILYEIFWILLIASILPKSSPFCIACGVFSATSLIEFFQLWQPPFLIEIRSTFWWHMLLGSTFVWWDFPHYFLGCVAAWIGLRLVRSNLFLTKSP